MIQDILPHHYHNEFQISAPAPTDSMILTQDDRILVRYEGTEMLLPTWHLLQDFGLTPTYLFSIDDRPYFLAEGDASDALCSLEAAEFRFQAPVTLRTHGPEDLRFAAVTGMQLARWYQANRFCGRCGHPTVRSGQERMAECPECGLRVYPKICPAVITGVISGDRILLTKYAGNANRPRYALIAGFAEVGETIEETVRREVMEETGVRVKNLHFYKSQPWSFSDSLLMGFFCELDGDDTIHMDKGELSVAQWVPQSETATTADGISLTSEMIALFHEKGRAVLTL